MKYQATIGTTNGSHKYCLTDTEVLDRYNRYFKRMTDAYPVAGAHATVTEVPSGWRNQHHQFTVTVRFYDGRQISVTRTLKGAVGRIELRRAHAFVTAVNNASLAGE